MADTRRTLAALQALLPDQVDGDIGAQDVRDFLVSVYPDMVVLPNEGIDNTGATDVTTEIQAVIDGGAHHIYAPGKYLISDTLLFDQWSGIIRGDGAAIKTRVGTKFIWADSAGNTKPMFQFQDSRYVSISDLWISGNDGTDIPTAGINFNNVSGDAQGTNEHLRVERVHLGANEWDPTAYLDTGILVDGFNANNDQFVFRDVTIRYPRSYGIRAENSQSVFWVFDNVVVLGDGTTYPVGMQLANDGMMLNPMFAYCDPDVKIIGTSTPHVTLRDYHSELSREGIKCTNPYADILIDNGTFLADNMQSGDYIFDFYECGPTGTLDIRHFQQRGTWQTGAKFLRMQMDDTSADTGDLGGPTPPSTLRLHDCYGASSSIVLDDKMDIDSLGYYDTRRLDISAVAGADDTHTILLADETWVNAEGRREQTYIFNALNYGATGDGTTNDTAAINTLLDDINTAGGGVAYFPTGVYRFTQTDAVTGYSMLLQTDVHIVGDGPGLTVFRALDSAPDYSVCFHSGTGEIDNVQIRNLTIDMNRGNRTFDYTDVTGVSLATNDQVTSTAHGLQTTTSVTFGDVGGATGVTINTPYYVRVLTADTFTLHTTAQDAADNTNVVDITGAGSNATYDVTFEHDHAIRLQSSAVGSYSTDILIDNVELMNVQGDGIFAWREVKRLRATRLRVHDCYRVGVNLHGASESSLTDSHMWNLKHGWVIEHDSADTHDQTDVTFSRNHVVATSNGTTTAASGSTLTNVKWLDNTIRSLTQNDAVYQGFAGASVGGYFGDVDNMILVGNSFHDWDRVGSIQLAFGVQNLLIVGNRFGPAAAAAPATSFDAAIYMGGTTGTGDITNVRVTGNLFDGSGGVAVQQTANTVPDHISIVDNTFVVREGYVLYVLGGDNVTFARNRVSAHSSYSEGNNAVYLDGTSYDVDNPVIEHNVFDWPNGTYGILYNTATVNNLIWRHNRLVGGETDHVYNPEVPASAVYVIEATVTFADADATPSVAKGNVFKTANTSATTITDFDDGYEGQEILVMIDDTNTSVDLSDNANIKGNGNTDVTAAAQNTSLRCTLIGTVWYCSVSAG